MPEEHTKQKWLCMNCNPPGSWPGGDWDSAPWMTRDEISKHLGEHHDIRGNDPMMKIALAGKVNICLADIHPVSGTKIDPGITVPLGDALLYVYTYSNSVDVLLWTEDQDLQEARARHDREQG